MAYRAVQLLVFLLFTTTVSAEFILSAPPREDPAAAERIYGPLAVELERILGEKVVFAPPVSWASYAHNMQEGKYDFVLDGPHFVAWRMAKTAHVPLVQFDGSLAYTVFTTKDGPATLMDLRFKDVCSMASPNLTAVVLLAQFEPYTSPNVLAPRGGVKGSYAAFREGRCVAVALPSYFTERLPPEKVADLRTLFASPQMPNLTLTAGPRVPAERHAAIISALTDAKVNLPPDFRKALAGNGTGKLVPARPAEFRGYEKLLEGVVWGW